MFGRITHFLNVNYRLTISFVNVIEITAIFPAVKDTSKLLLYEFRHARTLYCSLLRCQSLSKVSGALCIARHRVKRWVRCVINIVLRSNKT